MDSCSSKPKLPLKQQICNGYVPVLFSMSNNEIVSKKEPQSIFLLLPRMSYLLLVTNKIRKYFTPYAAALSDGIWFKYNDYPLKWNMPIGILFDLFNAENECSGPVWKVTVHFQSYPEEEIMRCDHIDTVKSMYFNALKQSIFLAYGNIHCISKLNKNDQNSLWNSICKANYNSYFAIYESIFTRNSDKLIRYPVRIILRGFDPSLDLIPIQRPIQVQNNESMTLNQCLTDIIPGVMTMYHNQLKNNKNHQNTMKINIIIQGIKMPLDVPLLWLIQNATAVDCFLYIAVIQQ